MEKPSKPTTELAKKRKRKSNTKINASEPKNKKLVIEAPTEKSKKVTPKIKNNKVAQEKVKPVAKVKQVAKVTQVAKVINGDITTEQIATKYPVLQDKELVAKFLKVPFNNNQRGRIKQAITLQLKSSNNRLNPDAINGKIQSIIKNSSNLTDSELRRIRVLYNMLNTTVNGPKQNNAEDNKDKEKPKIIKKNETEKKNELQKKKKNEIQKKNKVEKKKEVEKTGDVTESEDEAGEEKKEQLVQKVKGPKRYIVFVGNLPLNIKEEKLLDHFSEFRDRIKDVRLPVQSEEKKKKSAIAFVELADELTYEMALSKHHSMLDNKRINVLYSKQKNSKISNAEAKSKSAKLIALQKSGKLLGSVPLAKKRSQRRLKMKTAKQAAASA